MQIRKTPKSTARIMDKEIGKQSKTERYQEQTKPTHSALGLGAAEL